VRVEFPLDEVADGADDELLLGGELQVHRDVTRPGSG
jgi:hypothetical protein